jgi:aconitate hydratase
VKPYVKTSLAPGSRVVTEYYDQAGLTPYLQALGFHTVGYGCTTCIGNSGPLTQRVAEAVTSGDLVAAAVLSGNRNFEGRINPLVKANYLASPPLVVAHALAGTVTKDLTKEPIGTGKDGKPVYLRDVWPTTEDVKHAMAAAISRDMFVKRYADVFTGDEHWRAIPASGGRTYKFDAKSTYIQNPPYFEGMGRAPEPVKDILNARVLALFGDSITTDHISPAGSIRKDGPAGRYLVEHGIAPADFNSYGSRRGNHEVMMRGTFANIRIKNEMVPGVEGGVTIHQPSGRQMSIYDAAMEYQREGVPLVVFAGKEYGTGSSRDWAAKGTLLLGVRAVVAESFERIHRSNLVGMGVLPLQFPEGVDRKTLGLTGTETVDIAGLDKLAPRATLEAVIRGADGKEQRVSLKCRIDTLDELDYYRNGGILHYVLRKLLDAA